MKKILVEEHKIKQANILIQLLECFLLPIDIVSYLHKAFNEGKLKYGWGNFTIELRSRYGATYVYAWSIRNYILHRLGVTLMDFTGKFFKEFYIECKWQTDFDSGKQWMHHLNPIIAKKAKRYIYEKMAQN